MEKFEIKAEKKDDKKRLDLFIAQKLAGKFSRSFIQKLILSNNVLLNKKTAKSHAKIKPGDTVEMTLPPPTKCADTSAEDIPINIVYEDEHLIVIDKPAGMVVHPAAGNPSGTLVNALLFHCRDLSGIGGRLRPGIVHRLDKDTSGLIVTAKDDYTHRKLSNQFKSRLVKKRYVAFVKGTVQLDNGTIDLPITRHRRDRQKMAVGFAKSRQALTHYRVLKRFGDYTMLELELKTGRTHQIRAHMEHLGHPLLGDAKYGPKGITRMRIGRQALHASALGFTHPVTKKFMEFESALPDDMKRLL